jgi:thiamine kinase-like enzyme
MSKLPILMYTLGCVLTLLISQTTGWIIPLTAQHAKGRDSFSHRHSAVFASSQDTDVMPDTDTVTGLLEQAGIDANNVMIETVDEKSAFCNTLYRIRYDNATAIAKCFSPLALKRMDSSRTLGELDRLAATAGLAPEILASNSRGILMENCVGRVLTEEVVQQPNFSESASVATALARLHHLPVAPSATNILWKACDVMLSLTDEAHMDTSTGWTLSRLHRTIEQHREQLNALQLPITACGHGDCKPSNVFLVDSDNNDATDKTIKLLDLELAGTHYRAFDLAKFWRTNASIDSTNRNRHIFYETYASTTSNIVGDRPTNVDTLELEVDLLLPLTWLEAALFFTCMATQDAAAQSNHWNELAMDRLESYSQYMQGKRFDQLYVL